MSIMPDPADRRGTSPERERTDAAWNAVAIASVAYFEARIALGRILDTAQRHGLDTADLTWASGLDAETIGRLLREAEA